MREGFEVTALEPTGEGFLHFDRMRQMVLNTARFQRSSPTILDLPAECLAAVNRFDYAFSVNAMEQVDDVAGVLETVGKSLAVGASYRVTCPNYLFPYEQHFNIPIFFSKRLTGRLIGQEIFGSQRMPDPTGVRKYPNWINAAQVTRYVRRLLGLRLAFNCSMLISTLERIVSDLEFDERRSPSMRRFISGLAGLRMQCIRKLVPVLLQPISNCSIQKISDVELC